MDKSELQKKWIQALESGKYTQGRGKLKEKTSANGTCAYCCLGVLCEIIAPEKFTLPKPNESPLTLLGVQVNPSNAYCFGDPNRNSFPPTEILNQVGLDDDDAWILAKINDDGYSFQEIANKLKIDFNIEPAAK